MKKRKTHFLRKKGSALLAAAAVSFTFAVGTLSANAAVIYEENMTLKNFTLDDDTYIGGTLYVVGNIDINGYTLVVGGDFVHSGVSVNINGGRLVVNGNYNLSAITLQNDLYIDGNVYCSDDINLNGHTLSVGGNFIHSSGSIDINNGSFIVYGDYRMQTETKDNDGNVVYGRSYGTLKMNDDNDYMLVGGNFYTQSYYGDDSTWNDLSNGTLELKGDFYQINSYYDTNFKANKNHKTILSGDYIQKVYFQNYKKSYFNYLIVRNTIAYYDLPDGTYIEYADPSKVSDFSRISETEITLGESVRVRGEFFGGAAPYRYAVHCKKTSESKWTTLKKYGEEQTVTFTPSEVTSYDICLKAIDINGIVFKHYYVVNVKPFALENT